MKAQFLQLVGNPVFWGMIILYWLVSAVASALPDPDTGSGKGYRFLFAFTRAFVGQVKGAFAKYIPGSDGSSTKTQAGFSRIGAMLISSVVILVMLLGAWSCTSWERQQFQTLAGARDLVNCSVVAYNQDTAGKQQYCADPTITIPQTSTNQQLIDKVRKADQTAVISFRDYWCLAHPSKPIDPSLGAGPCQSLAPGETITKDKVQAAQQKATIALAALPELVAQLQALMSK
jgi:hypothetical protein